MCVKLLRTHILFECVCLRFFFVPNYRCKSVGLRSPFPSPPFLIFSLFPFPSDGREKQILFRVTEPASRLTSSFGFSARGVSTSSLVSMWNQQLLPRSSIPCHVSRIPVRARVELSHSKVRQTWKRRPLAHLALLLWYITDDDNCDADGQCCTAYLFPSQSKRDDQPSSELGLLRRGPWLFRFCWLPPALLCMGISASDINQNNRNTLGEKKVSSSKGHPRWGRRRSVDHSRLSRLSSLSRARPRERPRGTLASAGANKIPLCIG